MITKTNKKFESLRKKAEKAITEICKDEETILKFMEEAEARHEHIFRPRPRILPDNTFLPPLEHSPDFGTNPNSAIPHSLFSFSKTLIHKPSHISIILHIDDYYYFKILHHRHWDILIYHKGEKRLYKIEPEHRFHEHHHKIKNMSKFKELMKEKFPEKNLDYMPYAHQKNIQNG
ncbi:hypothetical protein HYW74_02025 [Candidatus Pacearchaeota archaeon]|nr:hypothetical protein [Candidatus Pacearchaeota archaeon]